MRDRASERASANVLVSFLLQRKELAQSILFFVLVVLYVVVVVVTQLPQSRERKPFSCKEGKKWEKKPRETNERANE